MTSEQLAPDAAPSEATHAERMDRQYRYQRHVYDLTRKYYLFGRDRLMDGLGVQAGQSVLEVGCGTGRNLAWMARRYPEARFYGLDISRAMLETAERKFAAASRPRPVLRAADATTFHAAEFGEAGFDRVVISYALSMIPAWRASAPSCSTNSTSAAWMPTLGWRWRGRPKGCCAMTCGCWSCRRPSTSPECLVCWTARR